MRKLSLTLAASLSLVLAAGCESDESNESAPPFPEGQGQEPNATEIYPEGPYGIARGSVVQNFKFVGFPRPSEQTEEAFNISLADFYNPTGAEVWPEGSPYGAGKAKPKALMIIVSAVWCGPCNYEADTLLPGEFAEYNPQGVEFLLNLADGPTVGTPAEFDSLLKWVGKYETPFPAVIDPSYKLSALFEANAFPANMIIDTRTMEIVEVVAGVPDESFFEVLEATIAE